MPVATNDGVALYYEHTGRGDADETVVFLQGLGYGRWTWRWQREAVADQYAVVAPDTRGTGRSDAGLPPIVPRLPRKLRATLLFTLLGYSIEGLAADLEAVLADAGVRDAHVVGASVGGMVAMQYALEYDRAASLVLCCTSPGGPDAPVPADTRDLFFDVPPDADERETLRHQLRPAFGEAFTNRNPHLLDLIVEWRLEQDAAPPAREAQAGAVRDFDVSDRLDRLDLPTVILHGTADRVLPVENAELIDERLPDSRLEVIEGGSHLFVVEDADRVNRLLLSFLTSPAKRIR